MTSEQPTITYDQFMPQPPERRRQIFSKISAENRALLIRTHIKRWLAVNRPRLNPEQIAVVKEAIRFISPDKYEEDRDMKKIHQGVESLLKKAEALLSPEDVRQIFSPRSDYIPPVKGRQS